ncbi:MucB/RseB C-terminal domain-containing protein [Neptunomonas qingdaonensis]|uniref:Negative regulator of sigma E activity n=1 Tax=Neptunomonas qingdaonensis TaxID=1045558 RepID=A0A1I2S580_9GAMM|nr:MucB/RseB C-terminal domain-containing protein [Neptunomonas qingdaonensis]SFG45161.1 Negative regulator of sigma E activity [Neptunomonas qingdaonensis]
MSDESNESLSASLSAAMDGEVSSFELRRVLARIQDKEGLDCEQSLDKWQRYHLAQQAIHGEGISQQAMNTNLVSRVSAALEGEKDQPAVQSPVAETLDNSEQHAWWKPVVSMAMAASVTAIVILGGQQFINNDAAVDGSFRQAYTIPSVQSSKDFVRAQYSSNYAAPNKSVSGSSGEPEVIRLSQGLNRYIEQHRHLLSSSQPAWQTDWLPEGYQQVRHEVMPHAEVMVFSNGKHSVSISIEPLGRQSVPSGVVQSNNIVAVGRATENGFVTVVGDVPLMIADRIAASVKSVR